MSYHSNVGSLSAPTKRKNSERNCGRPGRYQDSDDDLLYVEPEVWYLVRADIDDTYTITKKCFVNRDDPTRGTVKDRNTLYKVDIIFIGIFFEKLLYGSIRKKNKMGDLRKKIF